MTKLFVKFQFIEQNKINPDRLLKSVGVIFLFSAYQICLSVGATIGRPRASGERPYKNFLMRSTHLAWFFVLLGMVGEDQRRKVVNNQVLL